MSLSEDLRAVECEIDVAYRDNPLLSLPRTQAIWYFLAQCEELYMVRHVDEKSPDRAFSDTVINLAKWPCRWLWNDCRPEGKLPRRLQPDIYYVPAQEMADLGRSYEWFEAAFIYATKSRLSLQLDGHTIRPKWHNCDHVRNDAYDRLRDVADDGTDLPNDTVPDADIVSTLDIVKRTVRLQGRTFSYSLNPTIVRKVFESVDEPFKRAFQLPGSWLFPTAKLAQYATILKALWVLSLVHATARYTAAALGCPAVGYSQSLVIMQRDELFSRLSRYTDLDLVVVQAIVAELTFGGRGISNPDIALQPLVPMGADHYGWAPHLLLASAVERNLLILLNRVPESKSVYSQLSRTRETLMQQSFHTQLADAGLRFWSGKVPGWGTATDVDLAIIDEQRACCLLLELKAFLAPADPREVLDRAAAIEKGVRQIETRRKAARDNRRALNSILKIDDSFTVQLAVASENSASCGGMAELGDVPVLRSSHLIERIKSERDLRLVCKWISERRFLPMEEQDYRRLPFPVSIGRWTLDWYQIQTLAANDA